MVGNWKKSNNTSFDFVFKRGGQHVIHPVCNKKKVRWTGQNKIGQTNWLDLLGSTTFDLLFFFYIYVFFICFFSKLLFLFIFKSIPILSFIFFIEPFLNYNFLFLFCLYLIFEEIFLIHLFFSHLLCR